MEQAEQSPEKVNTTPVQAIGYTKQGRLTGNACTLPAERMRWWVKGAWGVRDESVTAEKSVQNIAPRRQNLRTTVPTSRALHHAQMPSSLSDPGANLLPIGYYINKEADSLKASDESDIWKGLIVNGRSPSKSRTRWILLGHVAKQSGAHSLLFFPEDGEQYWFHRKKIVEWLSTLSRVV